MPDPENELPTIKDKVKELLNKYPATRDSDKLICLAYYSIYHDLRTHADSYESLKDWLMGEDVPTFASIIRMRAWCQANLPETRGPKYIERLQRAENMILGLTNTAYDEGVGPTYDGDGY